MLGVGETQVYLETLARVNHHGFGFLVAFGLTWLTAGVVWSRWGERAGAYAALFQGLVGMPLALLLTALTATGPRPADASLNALSIYLGSGQLLVLPVAIVLIARQRYVEAVVVLAVVLAVHLVPYAWLYSTPIYLVVAALVAVLTAGLIGSLPRTSPRLGPSLCLGAGACLTLGGLVAFVG